MTMVEQKDVVRFLETIEVDEDGNFVPLNTWYSGIDEDYKYAIGQAIKALEQEPCEDAISRHAAIDALKQQAEEMTHWSERYAEQRKGILTAINIVSDLPFAQPMQSNTPNTLDAISRAEAIRIASGYCHFTNVPKELEKLPSVLPKQKTGHWIPVNERLPEEDGQYLITVKYKHVNDSYKDIYAEHGEWSDGRWDMFCFGHCGEVEGIIAWMPLPKPYKIESEGEE